MKAATKHENQQNVVNIMKVNNEMAIEDTTDLELKVYEQQHYIKHLLEKCDIEDEDEFQEIRAYRTPMQN